MTCYFRHLKDLFQKAGIPVTTQNKAEADKIIHKIVGEQYKNCPSTWRQVKKRIEEDEANFITELARAWTNRQSP